MVWSVVRCLSKKIIFIIPYQSTYSRYNRLTIAVDWDVKQHTKQTKIQMTLIGVICKQ